MNKKTNKRNLYISLLTLNIFGMWPIKQLDNILKHQKNHIYFI